MSFRLKTILGIAAIEIALLAILIVSGLHYLRSSNEDQLFERARTTARLFATMTSDAVLAMDLATLDTLVEQTLKNPGIMYVRIRHQNGTVLSEGGNQEALDKPFVEDATIMEAGVDTLLDVAYPIVAAGQTFGRVEIGVSTGAIESVMDRAGNWMFAIAALEIALVGIFGLLLGTILTRRLAYLRVGAKKVAAGEFGYQLKVRGDDELADTTRSFNRMSFALSQFADKARQAQKLAEEGRDYAETVLKDGMNSMPQAMLMVDKDEKITFANDAFRSAYPETLPVVSTGGSFSDVATFMMKEVDSDDVPAGADSSSDRVQRLREAERFGSWKSTMRNGSVVMNSQRRMSRGGVVVVETDVTELYEALERNRQLEMELMESQKRESMGTLAGGIAHEINTPVQYIGNNIRFLTDAFAGIVKGLDACIADLPVVDSELQNRLKEMDWEFLVEEVPAALSEAAEGVENVSRIVLSMKEVSFPESDEKSVYDLRKLVENSLTVSRNQWKYCADVECDIEDGNFEVPCFPGELSQVLINLLVNAAHAVEDKADAGERGLIRVSLAHEGSEGSGNVGMVKLQVSDNGSGIAPENLDRIFDMFFTTKGPGKGTGQGLAICRSIVAKKHGGDLSVTSEPGAGTTFTIVLPQSEKERLAS